MRGRKKKTIMRRNMEEMVGKAETAVMLPTGQ